MSADVTQLDLGDYLRVLRRRKWTILIASFAVVASVVGVSLLQTPIYQGTAELLLQPRGRDTLFETGSGQRSDPARALQTEIQVLKSEPVRSAVRRELGVAPKVTARPIGQTDVIEVRARSTIAEEAAALANAYATAYIEYRRRQAVDDLLAAGEEIQAKVDELQAQIDELSRQAGAAGAAAQDPAGQGTAARRDALVSQQALFKQKLDQLQVDAALRTGGAQLVTPAPVPKAPVRPTPVRNGIVGLGVGLFLGIGLAFVLEHLDDSVKSLEDVGRVVAEMPLLGVIPAVTDWKARTQAQLVTQREPWSPAAESYRSLRTSLQFLSLERPTRTVQITSPSPGEGKTTTLANLAVSMARTGQRVAIICCDLRRPRIHSFFELPNTCGFTSVLLGQATVEEALQRVPGGDDLFLLASGPLPPNPSELLSSRRTADVLATVQARVDVVLVDSPPVLPVTDASVLSGRVDATLLVVAARSTGRHELTRSLELLRQVGAPLIGVVLNGVMAERSDRYLQQYYRDEGRKAAVRRP